MSAEYVECWGCWIWDAARQDGGFLAIPSRPYDCNSLSSIVEWPTQELVQNYIDTAPPEKEWLKRLAEPRLVTEADKAALRLLDQQLGRS